MKFAFVLQRLLQSVVPTEHVTALRYRLPLLYHTVEVCVTGRPCKTVPTAPGRGPNLTALLRTCLHNEGLALTIRELRVGAWEDIEKQKGQRVTDLFWYEKILSRVLISHPCKQRLRNGLAASLPDAELALLFTLCRNVRDLELTATNRVAFTLVTELLLQMGKNNNSRSLFPRLHTLTIRGAGDDTSQTGFELWEVAPFVRSADL